MPDASKQQVKDLWNNAACGEDLYLSSTDFAAYERQARKRYSGEPFIENFTSFEDVLDRYVWKLELS